GPLLLLQVADGVGDLDGLVGRLLPGGAVAPPLDQRADVHAGGGDDQQGDDGGDGQHGVLLNGRWGGWVRPASRPGEVAEDASRTCGGPGRRTGGTRRPGPGGE